MKKKLVKLVLAVAVATGGLVAAHAGTAAADYPCAGKGGVIFAQASGVGDESSVEVQCRDGSWELLVHVLSSGPGTTSRRRTSNLAGSRHPWIS